MAEKYTYKDIRQSDSWFKFWEHLGWKRILFNPNISARVLNNIFGSSIVVEKPRNISQENLIEIESFAKANKTVYLQIKPGLSQTDDLFEKNNYEYITKPNGVTKTGIINLQSPLDNLFKNFSYRVRHLIKTSSAKTKINIKNNPTASEIEEFYQVYRQGGLSKKFFTYSESAFRAFRESFKNNCFLCSVKSVDNKYLGGCVFVFEGKTVWYIFSALNENGRKLDAGYAMLWQGMGLLKNKGFEFLDLDGLYDERYPDSFSGHQGYTEFKLHFRPEIVYFPKIRVKYFNKIYRLLDKI